MSRGIVTTVKLIDVDVEQWDRVMAVNLRSAMLLAQASARHMLERGTKGQMIFTSSWVSETPWPEIGPYHTSKAGMNQLMCGFARELAADGIRANAVAPGIVGAGMAKHHGTRTRTTGRGRNGRFRWAIFSRSRRLPTLSYFYAVPQRLT